MKTKIKPGYIDFLRSEAESVLADKITHTELEKDLSKGLLDLIDLIKDLDTLLQTILPRDTSIADWAETYPTENEEK